MTDKMMFVYVDDKMNIKAISPVKDETHDYKFIMFPVNDVRHFLEGKASLSQFKLSQSTKDITKFEIIPKIIEINDIRVVESFLSLIEYKHKADIQLIHFTKSKKVEFRMHPVLKTNLLHANNAEEGSVRIMSMPTINFYFCANEDPCFLINTLTVTTDNLVNEWGQTIFYDDRLDLNNATVFTQRVFKSYSYEAIDE